MMYVLEALDENKGVSIVMAGQDQNDKFNEDETGLLAKEKNKLKAPNLYRILMINDDFTPMDFVIELLETIFHKPHDEAVAITYAIHNEGMGLCGIFTYEVAESKVSQCIEVSRRSEYPLKCVMDKL